MSVMHLQCPKCGRPLAILAGRNPLAVLEAFTAAQLQRLQLAHRCTLQLAAGGEL